MENTNDIVESLNCSRKGRCGCLFLSQPSRLYSFYWVHLKTGWNGYNLVDITYSVLNAFTSSNLVANRAVPWLFSRLFIVFLANFRLLEVYRPVILKCWVRTQSWAPGIFLGSQRRFEVKFRDAVKIIILYVSSFLKSLVTFSC